MYGIQGEFGCCEDEVGKEGARVLVFYSPFDQVVTPFGNNNNLSVESTSE